MAPLSNCHTHDAPATGASRRSVRRMPYLSLADQLDPEAFPLVRADKSQAATAAGLRKAPVGPPPGSAPSLVLWDGWPSKSIRREMQRGKNIVALIKSPHAFRYDEPGSIPFLRAFPAGPFSALLKP
jgi:hypothetical protein